MRNWYVRARSWDGVQQDLGRWDYLLLANAIFFFGIREKHCQCGGRGRRILDCFLSKRFWDLLNLMMGMEIDTCGVSVGPVLN